MDEKVDDVVDLISLDIVMKGAGPILTRLNELISKGKKLIVADAVSSTDLEQIALAIKKSTFKILPSGSAGAAQALGKIWHPEVKENLESDKIVLPHLPKLVVSGSATELTASQIKRLQENADIENTYFIAVKPENIFSNDCEMLGQRILNNLNNSIPFNRIRPSKCSISF